jgi:uncharacterized protein YlxP (DUF503 family)
MSGGFPRYRWREQLRMNGVVAFIAPRGSGKSTLIRYVLYELRNRFDLAVAFVGSPEAARNMEAYIHRAFVFASLDSDELMDHLEAVVDESEALADRGTPRRVCIIMEDLGDDKKFMRSNRVLKKICARGRHSGITLIFSAQQAHQIPPEIRANIDAMGLLFIKGEERAAVKKAFFSSLNTKEFDRIVEALCVNFRAIILDTTKQSATSNGIFYCQAPVTVPRFNLLSPVFRAIADSMVLSSAEILRRDEAMRQRRRVEREKRLSKMSSVPLVSTKEAAVMADDDTLVIRKVAASDM